MANNFCGFKLLNLFVILELFSYASGAVFQLLETNYTTEYYAAKFGYGYEAHTVITPDGYYLEIHRIISPVVSDENRPVIFLMHGLLGASNNYNFWNKSLAYFMCDRGFDVWMGNARGNQFSIKHERYLSEDPRYWDFSWNEIGIYDLPTMIDYILDKTAQPNLVYVGHSQGTTAITVLASLIPDFVATRITSIHMLAPVVFMEHIKGIIRVLSDLVIGGANPLAPYLASPFLPNTILTGIVGTPICPTDLNICENLLNLLFGPTDNLEHSILVDALRILPAGSSTNQIQHYAQLVRSHAFRKMDYTSVVNLLKYGSLSPPDYPLSQIIAKIFLYYGGNDFLSQIKDVDRFRSIVQIEDSHFFPDFSHLDYLGASQIDTVLNPLIYKNIVNSNK